MRRNDVARPIKIALIACMLVLASQTLAEAGPGAARHFQMFDSLLFSGSPDFSKYGFEHLRIVDSHELWIAGDDTTQPPTSQQIQKIVSGDVGPSNMLLIDIENWNMTASDAAIAASRQKYIETLDQFRKTRPGWKFALYDVLPGRDYWRAIGAQGPAAYQAWLHEIDEARPIVPHVDALFPSLYTFYPDQAGWVKYATENLRQARRIANGKPVYCFLWPQYHDSSTMAFQLVSGDYWRTQLETCHKLADGIVIWGGYNSNNGFTQLPWDDNAPWWQQTLAFLKTLRH